MCCTSHTKSRFEKASTSAAQETSALSPASLSERAMGDRESPIRRELAVRSGSGCCSRSLTGRRPIVDFVLSTGCADSTETLHLDACLHDRYTAARSLLQSYGGNNRGIADRSVVWRYKFRTRLLRSDDGVSSRMMKVVQPISSPVWRQLNGHLRDSTAEERRLDSSG